MIRQWTRVLTDAPVFTVWYGFDPQAERFNVLNTYPAMYCSDATAVTALDGCPSGILLTDIDGTKSQYWAPVCNGSVGFTLGTEVTGYAGLAPGRGMAAVGADLDGDGAPDIVTKQLRGSTTDANQIEITVSSGGGSQWTRVLPNPINTSGLATQTYNGILRPHDVVVADLRGNSLPEIIAGFAASYSVRDGIPNARTIKVGIWQDCLGDVNKDGRTDCLDLGLVPAALGQHVGSPLFNPDADVDKDGWVSAADLALVRSDFGCTCWNAPGQRLGDLNCDGVVNDNDIGPYLLALEGEAAYYAVYRNCNWLNGDCNLDGTVDNEDTPGFLRLVCRTELSIPTLP